MKRCLVFCLIVMAWPVLADTIVTGPDGPYTIQQAVDLADPGDGVYTDDGNRDVRFAGKPITVRSQSGDPSTCIIDCEGSATEHHRGFNFDRNGELDSVLEGVTITGGHHSHGGAVACIGGAPTIRHCRFVGNATYAGGGSSAQISWNHVAPRFVRCTYVNNTADDSGGGRRT